MTTCDSSADSQRAQIFTRPRIPKLDQHVFTPTRHESLAWVPIDTPHVPSVTAQDFFLLLAPEIPNLDRPVVSTRDKLFIVGAERDGSDCFPMGGEGFEVVDRRGIILEDPALVPREEKETRVTVSEGTDGVVVCLFEGFKVEGRTVPDGELAHLVARQTPTSVRCPLPRSA